MSPFKEPPDPDNPTDKTTRSKSRPLHSSGSLDRLTDSRRSRKKNHSSSSDQAKNRPPSTSPPPPPRHHLVCSPSPTRHSGNTSLKQPRNNPTPKGNPLTSPSANPHLTHHQPPLHTPTTSTNTQPEIPPPPPSDSNTPPPPPPGTSNQIIITNHSVSSDNPLILHKLILDRKLKIKPPQQNWSFRKKSTLLTFISPQEALTFINAIPASPTFGPSSTYIHHQRVLSPPKPKPSSPRNQHEVVVRGVNRDILAHDFLVNIRIPNACPCLGGFKRAQRINDREGEPTGLVRLYSDCQTCSATALQEGIDVCGRIYKVEPPRNPLIRPCLRCHEYGHHAPQCPNPHRCRTCGKTSSRPDKPCSHTNLDLSRPFCATCSAYGHYTGQRVCPRYPKNLTDPSHPPIRYVPAPLPAVNPWKMSMNSFPPLTPDLTPVSPPVPPTTDPSPQDPPLTPTDTNQTTKTPSSPDTSSPPTVGSNPPSPPGPSFVTAEYFHTFMDRLLEVMSEGFKRTFDTLLSVFLSITPVKEHEKFREAANRATKTGFDMRTIFQSVGSSITILHSNSKR